MLQLGMLSTIETELVESVLSGQPVRVPYFVKKITRKLYHNWIEFFARSLLFAKLEETIQIVCISDETFNLLLNNNIIENVNGEYYEFKHSVLFVESDEVYRFASKHSLYTISNKIKDGVYFHADAYVIKKSLNFGYSDMPDFC